MILTQEQYELLYGEGTRSGVPEAWERRWPDNKLPYKIHSSVLSSDIDIIESSNVVIETHHELFREQEKYRALYVSCCPKLVNINLSKAIFVLKVERVPFISLVKIVLTNLRSAI